MGSKPAAVGAEVDEPMGSDASEVERWRQIGARLQEIDPLYFVRLSTRIEVALIARETKRDRAKGIILRRRKLSCS